MPGKPGKHSLVCSNHFEGGRLTRHHDCAAAFDFPKRPSTLCAFVRRQRSSWQRRRNDLELHHSEQTHKTQVTRPDIARGHGGTAVDRDPKTRLRNAITPACCPSVPFKALVILLNVPRAAVTESPTQLAGR